MSFISSNLLKGEKLIYLTRIHWIIFGIPVAFFVAVIVLSALSPKLFPGYIPFTNMRLGNIVVLICLAATIFSGITTFIRYATSEYGVTNRRLVMKVGWISRDSLELFVDKLEAIYVDQSILGRILNYGTLRVVGTGGTEDPFFYVPQPLNFRKVALEQISQENQR